MSIPGGHVEETSPLVEFATVMHRLRVECPWKAEQTHRSLSRYLLEETHEVIEAIQQAAEAIGEPGRDEHLCEELGDLLLQVYFHAEIAQERGAFTLDDVARGIIAKMVRRNPHVFAGAPAGVAPDAVTVNETWQQIKSAERAAGGAAGSPVDDLPATLPALLYADKVVDRLARAGTPVQPGEVCDETGTDLGERLLALVVEAHADGVDPEQALRDAVRRRATR